MPSIYAETLVTLRCAHSLTKHFKDSYISLTSFSPVFVLQFSFSIIHGNGRVAKNGEGLGIPITRMTSGGCEVDEVTIG